MCSITGKKKQNKKQAIPPKIQSSAELLYESAINKTTHFFTSDRPTAGYKQRLARVLICSNFRAHEESVKGNESVEYIEKLKGIV